jgi:hypothetical protein
VADSINPTRKELGYFQRNEIEINLANGMKVRVPALTVLGAILTVLDPAQRRQVFETCLRQGSSPFMIGPQLTVPNLSKGLSNGG